MRPFKFFFSIALGVIIFLFLARFIIAALFIAAVLSVLFYVARRLRYFFYNLSWRDEDYEQPMDWSYSQRALPPQSQEWYFEQFADPREYTRIERTIEIQ